MAAPVNNNSNLKGTTSSTFRIGKQKAQLRGESATELSVRNASDSAYAPVRVGTPTLPEHAATRAYVDSIEGDRIVTGAQDLSALPNNSATKQYKVGFPSAGNPPNGTLTYDNGENDGNPVTILAAKTGRSIVTQAGFVAGTFSFDAFSQYLWDGATWVKTGDIGSVTNAEKTIEIPLGNTATVDSTEAIPAGAVVSKAIATFTTAYPAGVTLQIGIAGDLDKFMGADQNDPQEVGMNTVEQRTIQAPSSVFRITLAGAPLTGVGVAMVTYSSPKV